MNSGGVFVFAKENGRGFLCESRRPQCAFASHVFAWDAWRANQTEGELRSGSHARKAGGRRLTRWRGKWGQNHRTLDMGAGYLRRKARARN